MSGRRFAVALAALLVAAPAAAQPPRAGMQQRAMMEELVLERFLDTVARDIQLSAEQRTRVGEILRTSAGRHRTRMTEGQRLRRELIAAVDAEDTTDEEFVALLDRMERLRTQEQSAWRADQRAIAAVLAPRQRAAFMLRWMAFQDSVREMIGRRGAGRGGGPPRR